MDPVDPDKALREKLKIIVKNMNVYDVLAGDKHYIVFSPNETKAGIDLLKHTKAETIPEPFEAEFVQNARGLVLEGTLASLKTAEDRARHSDRMAAYYQERAAKAEGEIGHYKEKLEAAEVLVAELRELLAMMKVYTKNTRGLEDALKNYDSIVLPDA